MDEGKEHTKVGVPDCTHKPIPCKTTVPRHKGDLAQGTVKGIQKRLAPCLGSAWLEDE